MLKHLLLLILIFLQAQCFQAQIKNILISTASDPEEVSIAINPKNTNQIIAGANLASYYFSHNGGETWERKVLKCPAYNVWGDPVVFWDTLENAYYMHLSNPFPKITPDGSWVDRIVVNKSTDKGLSYPDCYAFGKDGKKVQDKHWAVVSPFTNHIHATWTQFDKYESKNPKDSSIIRYARSEDGGLTWSEPIRISFYAGDCLDSDNTVEGAVPCIGPKNEIYAAWAGPKGLVFNRSLNNGATWLAKETFIDSIPEGWDYKIDGLYRANGLPFTACDISKGPNHGRIYVCWSDAKFGSANKDVFLVYSDDIGKTWSDRVLITYYPNHKQQFMPHFTIDQSNGYLYVLYYDRRNYSKSDLTDVYLSVSRDGGKSFSHHRINEKPFSPHKDVFFGDYIGVSAHNGMVRPMWMQMDENKKLGVYTALLNDSLLMRHSEVKTINLEGNSAAIYAKKTKIVFSSQLTGKYDAYLYKATEPGFEVKIALNKKLKQGVNIMSVPFKKLKLPKGTYVLMLYNNNRSEYVWITEE